MNYIALFFFASRTLIMRLTRLPQIILLALLCTSQLSVNAGIQFSESLFASISKRYNKTAEMRVRAWQNLIDNSKDLPLEEQLYKVNLFFNRVSFVDDQSLWNKLDYWATPIEFLSLNAGDCEDFTIAKYMTLIALGIDDEKLRFMYVTVKSPRQAHMVLAYYEQKNAIPLILDNINKRILPASMRDDLMPIYSFNGEGLWLAKEQGRGRKMQSSNNNKLWADLQKRMLAGNY